MVPVVLGEPNGIVAPPTPYQIEVRCLTAAPTAVVRAAVRPDSVAHWVSRAHEQVHAVLDAHGVPVAGPPFARFISIDEKVSIEAGFPVPAAIGDLGDVTEVVVPYSA